MTDSILNGTKKALGIPEDYDAFNLDITMHINTIFGILTQLGVGPEEGFMIEGDEEVWADFIGENINLNAVRSYIYLRVRILFDPPQTSFLLDTLTRQYQELEWRLNVSVDQDTDVDIPTDQDDVIDGGDA